MSSLFGHLVTRFSQGPENMATEALAYVLARSPAARRALNRIPASLDLRLPEIRSFRTQSSAEDLAIPDLAGFDAEGRVRVLLENKFWAGLTPNQPAAYLERLPEDGLGLLMFVVPRRRLHAIWPDLVASAARAGVDLPAARPLGSDVLWARVGARTLAVTSWTAVLDRIEAEARVTGEDSALSDVAQLRGLCEQMDTTGYVPATLQELTNVEVPRRLIALADLIPELCDRAVASGIADTRGLGPARSWHSAGRYIRIGAPGGAVGIEHRYWARYGVGPLWIAFGPGEFGRGAAVLDAVAAWITANPARAFDADGSAVIPLRITPNATRDIVLEDLLSQLAELHRLLKGVRTVPSAASLEPPEDSV